MELDDLLCDEDLSSWTHINGGENPISVSREDSDFVEMSFGKEAAFRPDGNRDKTLSENERLEEVQRVLEWGALFGYHRRTAYLSLIYFDRFLAEMRFPDDNLSLRSRLLSIACLSIAAKMEEVNARPFMQYQFDGLCFEGFEVQKMELCVMSALDWRMSVVTPFTYVYYFVAMFCEDAESRHQDIANEASEFIVGILEEINAAENRPSIVAAGSVLAAYDHRLDKAMLESKMDAIPSWGSEEKEQTFSFYCLLLQQILKVKTPKSAITSPSARDTTTTSGGGTKRKLDFPDNDQDYPVKRNPRL